MSKLETILLYQDTEQKKQKLESELRSTPARQKFNQLHKLLKSKQSSIQQLNDEMEKKSAYALKLTERAKSLEDRYELEASELETISQDEESTAEEVTELRRDVEKLQKELNALMKEVKQLVQDITRDREAYKDANQTARDAKKEYDELRTICEKERDDSNAEMVKIDAELKKIAKDIDPAFLQKYEKVRQHHPVPVVPVVGGKCGGCNMSLAMVMLKKLNGTDAFDVCENCGRILYGEQS